MSVIKRFIVKIKNNKSLFILICLWLVMFLIKLFDLIFEPNKIYSGRTAVFSWPEFIMIIILGFIGLFFYQKIGLPEFINKKIKKLKVIFISAGFGLLFAFILVIFDYFVRIGDLSVGWPLSILFYTWGAISSEIIFRLFAVSFFTWLFSSLILQNKHKSFIYFLGSGLFSVFAAFSMVVAFSLPETNLIRPSDFALIVLVIIVFCSELYSFKLQKQYGFLSSLIFRLSFYSLWHVFWPLIIY